MKKISLLSALLLFVIITFAQTNFTATYNFAGNETNVVSFAYNGDTYEGITPQPLLKVGVTSTSIDNHFRAKGWPLGATEGSSEFTGTIDLAKYIGFSIEPVAGYAFTITSIKFGVGRSGTGPRQLEWRGNADGFASALSTYEALNTNLTNVDGVLTCPDGNSGWTNNTLTPGVAYQDLATAAEFRLYAYNSEADGGTAGLQGNLIIEGTFVETGAAGLTITSPANNTTVYENQVEVTFSTANFVLGNDGKLEYKLNGTTAYTTTSPLTISGLVEGENIIDFQLVDMNDQALDPAVTKTLTIYYIDPSAPISNGLETFDNATLSGSSYSDGSFVGNHGITWNYLQARSQGLYPIDGNGLILKSAQESSIESQVLSGGIGSFEVKFRKAFTGANERGLELYINDELKGTSEVIPSSSEANPTIYTFSVNDINISGNVVIKIKIAGTDTQGRQITIDDIAWTSYEGTEPTLTITTPADNTTVNVNEVEVNFSTTNFDIGTAGKLEYKLNGETANYVNTTDLFTITGLQEGENTIFFQLVNMEHNALDPVVSVTRTVTYEVPSIEPSLTITSPADNTTVNVNEVQVTFTTTNFDIGTAGKLEYKLNGGEPVYKTESPFTITNLQEGENTIFFQLVNMEHNALDPVVSETRTVTYEIVVLEPSLTINSPEDGAIIYSNDITVNFTVEDFVLGEDGKLAYKLDEGETQYYTGASPLTLTNVAYGAHQLYFELVTMENASLDPAVNATVNFTNQASLPGGMETFTNANIGASYTDGSFVGDNDIQWTYKHSRDEGAYPINGKGLMLRNAQRSSIESQLSGGIASFEVNFRKAFTGANERGLELYINNELKGTSEMIPSLSGENTTIYTFNVEGINIPGDFTMKIKIAGTDTLNRQITIDNISWTSYDGTEPSLTINTPANNAIVNEAQVEVNFTTANFDIGTAGKLEYKLNGGDPVYKTESPFTITNLAEGENTIVFQLVDMDNTALDPAVIVTRTVTYEIVSTEPSLTINSPQNGATIYSEDINVNFSITNFELGEDGKLAYKLDEGATQYYTGASPLTLTNVAYGEHQLYFELVTMANASLDPVVSTTVNFTNQAPLPGGMETFELSNIGSDYTDGSFIGDNDIEWFYKHSRDQDTFPINNKGLILRRAALSSIESQVLNGGIGSFEVKFRKAYTGAKERGLELYINGELKGTSEIIPSSSGENTTIYTFSVNEINEPGDFKIKIKIAGTDSINRQITIDDISWTNYNSTEPYLAITSPSDGQVFYESTVSVSYSTLNHSGKVKYIIDGAEPVYTTNNPIVLTNLDDGEHNFSLELVNMDNTSLSPAIIRTVSFTTNTAGIDFTDIYDIQYTTDPSGDSPLKDQSVWIKGVVTANFNGSQYGKGYYVQQGGGAWRSIYIYDAQNTPTVGDSVIIAGMVVEFNGLTEIKDITSFEAFTTDGIIAPPTALSTAEAGTEPYEGCLVKVTNAKCTQGIEAYGEWKVNDNSGELIAKENGVSSIQPVVGKYYDIVGVIAYGYGNFSLQYRSDDDIVVTNINEDFANSLCIYPNPANSFVNISSEFVIENIKITNNLGQIVLEQNAKSNNVNLNIENLEPGVYFINITNNDQNTVLRFIKE